MRKADTQQPGDESDLLLEGNQVKKAYQTDAGEVSAVNGISLNVERGEVVGLLGPNGAGKTTFIKCCLGIISPTDGNIKISGVDPFKSPNKAYRFVAAMLEGARNVYWRLTVRENLRFFAGLQGRQPTNVDDRCDKVLSRVGLTEKSEEMARNLSRGMKQKLSLACALIRETPLLFLDEPTLGLDVEAKEDLKDEITRLANEQNRGIVVCSHDMDAIREVCDRVIIINNGEVVTKNEIEALLDAFKTRSYRIKFTETGDAHSTLGEFHTKWEDREEDHLKITISNNEALYDLMDQLRSCGAVIESIDTIQPDLAEIFIEITDNSRQWASENHHGHDLDERDKDTDRTEEVTGP